MIIAVVARSFSTIRLYCCRGCGVDASSGASQWGRWLRVWCLWRNQERSGAWRRRRPIERWQVVGVISVSFLTLLNVSESIEVIIYCLLTRLGRDCTYFFVAAGSTGVRRRESHLADERCHLSGAPPPGLPHGHHSDLASSFLVSKIILSPPDHCQQHQQHQHETAIKEQKKSKLNRNSPRSWAHCCRLSSINDGLAILNSSGDDSRSQFYFLRMRHTKEVLVLETTTTTTESLCL